MLYLKEMSVCQLYSALPEQVNPYMEITSELISIPQSNI